MSEQVVDQQRVALDGNSDTTIQLSWETRPRNEGHADLRVDAIDGGSDGVSVTLLDADVAPEPDEFGLQVEAGGDAQVGIPVGDVETDADSITIETRVHEDRLALLSRYRDAGDIVRESTAFGAFRRVTRDGSGPMTIEPPDDLNPPFETQTVAPEDSDIEQISPAYHDAELSLGLTEPRPRDPIRPDPDTESEPIGSETRFVRGGETISTTISGTAPVGTGNYVLSAAVGDAQDTGLLSVIDADVVIGWPVATLGLERRQIGQLQRSPDAGRERITLPARLSPGQAEILMAAGSRVDAVQTRRTPDERNQLRDTLPDDQLTASLIVAAEPRRIERGETVSIPRGNAINSVGIGRGETRTIRRGAVGVLERGEPGRLDRSGYRADVILVDWSLRWDQPSRRPLAAEMTFEVIDDVDIPLSLRP